MSTEARRASVPPRPDVPPRPAQPPSAGEGHEEQPTAAPGEKPANDTAKPSGAEENGTHGVVGPAGPRNSAPHPRPNRPTGAATPRSPRIPAPWVRPYAPSADQEAGGSPEAPPSAPGRTAPSDRTLRFSAPFGTDPVGAPPPPAASARFPDTPPRPGGPAPRRPDTPRPAQPPATPVRPDAPGNGSSPYRPPGTQAPRSADRDRPDRPGTGAPADDRADNTTEPRFGGPGAPRGPEPTEPGGARPAGSSAPRSSDFFGPRPATAPRTAEPADGSGSRPTAPVSGSAWSPLPRSWVPSPSADVEPETGQGPGTARRAAAPQPPTAEPDDQPAWTPTSAIPPPDFTLPPPAPRPAPPKPTTRPTPAPADPPRSPADQSPPTRPTRPTSDPARPTTATGDSGRPGSGPGAATRPTPGQGTSGRPAAAPPRPAAAPSAPPRPAAAPNTPPRPTAAPDPFVAPSAAQGPSARPSTPPAAPSEASLSAVVSPDPALSWSAPMAPGKAPGATRPVVTFARPEGFGDGWRGAGRRGRTVVAAACVVLGLGLIGGAVTGSWLIGDAEGSGARDTYAAAGGLWHNVPVDDLFPVTVDGQGAGPGGADRTWTRIAVAPDSGCADAFDPLLRQALTPVGCQRLLRATYTDATQSYVTTVGLLFTTADAAGMRALDTRFDKEGLGRRTDLMPKPYAAKGTAAVSFGDKQRASWTISVLTDAPVVVYAVSGWADGRTVDSPEPATQATASGATTAPAQAGLGNEARGLADRIERSLRKTAVTPPSEQPS
ncbi:hypothetical protein ACH4U3_41360 [Streptomyces griseoruber]|uniref:hypothetical protein n=1 Tax=Streptomyces griseoruber TaxID=1943 RepID=UPI00378FA67B